MHLITILSEPGFCARKTAKFVSLFPNFRPNYMAIVPAQKLAHGDVLQALWKRLRNEQDRGNKSDTKEKIQTLVWHAKCSYAGTS